MAESGSSREKCSLRVTATGVAPATSTRGRRRASARAAGRGTSITACTATCARRPEFSVYANWPGAIHEGNGEALILIDERADAAQRAAIETLLGGKIGGPWGVLGWTWPKFTGRFRSRTISSFDGVHTRLKCGDYVDVECGPIKNPVTGAEVASRAWSCPRASS